MSIGSGQEELLCLQSRQFHLQENLALLTERMNNIQHSSKNEHDVDDHLTAHQLVSLHLDQQIGDGHCNTVSSKPITSSSPRKPDATDGLDLQQPRDETNLLRSRYHAELETMRSRLHETRLEMAKLSEESRSAPLANGKENIENALGSQPYKPCSPPSLTSMDSPPKTLTEAQRILADTTKRRKMFEFNIANWQRNRQQKDIFSFLRKLGESNDESTAMLRMIALLDDAVINSECVQKTSPTVATRGNRVHSRIDDLAIPKRPPQRTNLEPQPRCFNGKQPASRLRPLSASPTTANHAFQRNRTSGLTTLVGDSSTRPIASSLRSPSGPGSKPAVHSLKPLPIQALQRPSVSSKSVHFEKNRSFSGSPLRNASVETDPKRSRKTKSSTYIPLGMRQYSMWPLENLSSEPIPMQPVPSSQITDLSTSIISRLHPTADGNLLGLDAVVDAVLRNRLARVEERGNSLPRQFQCVDAGTSPLSELSSTSSRRVTSTMNAGRHQSPPSAQKVSSPKFRDCAIEANLPLSSSSCLTSVRSKNVATSSHHQVLSSISNATSNDWKTKSSLQSVETEDDWSLTAPHTFSEGLLLEDDHSEGELSRLPIGVVEALDLAKKLGAMPISTGTSETDSSSRSLETPSSGEFTTGCATNRGSSWIAPWRDPVLHLIALNASKQAFKVAWHERQDVSMATASLKHCGKVSTRHHGEITSDPDDAGSVDEGVTHYDPVTSSLLSSSSVGVVSPANVSVGEVYTLSKQLRRRVLAKSALRRRNHGVDSLEDELTPTCGTSPTQAPPYMEIEEETSPQQGYSKCTQSLLSAAKDFSDEDECSIYEKRESSHGDWSGDRDLTFDCDFK